MIASALALPASAAVVCLGCVGYLVRDVLKKPRGTEPMIVISNAVQVGAAAFLRREYRYILGFVALIAGLIAAAPLFASEAKYAAVSESLGWQTSVSFIIGALASTLAGFIGMAIATRANSRTAEAARSAVEQDGDAEKGLRQALSVAFSGGAVMGLSVVGIGLLGLIAVILFVDLVAGPDDGLAHPGWINGYAMGASLVALFSRSGGGIFTKGADMGADLVGKVEAGIPEDDPRNAATIADNVGDNVGDVAGLGADLMESYIEAIIAAMALAGALGIVAASGEMAPELVRRLQMLPLLLAASGIGASLVGVAWVKFKPGLNVQGSLMSGTYFSAAAAAVATFAVVKIWVPGDYMIAGQLYTSTGLALATLAGIVAGCLVGVFSEYYTSGSYKPVQRMAKNSQMGPAITVTDGLALGMKSTALPLFVLGIAMLAAFFQAHYLGVALAAFGMLATTGMVVAVDSYGPIADNAGGCAEMAHLDPKVREITDRLDAVGNTTAAIGKGFAIGSAAFAALGLLVAYMATAGVEGAMLNDPTVLFGLMLGGMVPFFFSSMLFDAVSQSAFKMIDEVRRQLREAPGIMTGEETPDYARCVDISTDGAIKGMLIPGILALGLPPAVGFIFGAKALAGFLIGAIACGVVLGMMCANSGGAMDNAKKFIEESGVTDENGVRQGKGSEAHKAAVIGDTVGDPLKDTVGPSINILIKLMAVISLVIAPLLAL